MSNSSSNEGRSDGDSIQHLESTFGIHAMLSEDSSADSCGIWMHVKFSERRGLRPHLLSDLRLCVGCTQQFQFLPFFETVPSRPSISVSRDRYTQRKQRIQQFLSHTSHAVRPNAHTSLAVENSWVVKHSGAIHFMGHRPPCKRKAVDLQHQQTRRHCGTLAILTKSRR